MADPVYAWDRPAGLSPHASGRSVYAWWHYFQRAFTDQPVASDYYTTQFLNPHGQGSSAWGSYIKDRPLSRPARGGSMSPAYQEEYRKADMHSMCMDCYDAGLDGFQFNTINHYDTTQDGSALPNILEGAKRSAASGKPIKIMLMSDGITGSQTPASAKAAIFKKYKDYPHVLKTADGKLVLGAFGPELSAGGNPAHWSEVIAGIGAPVYFIPTFLNPSLCTAANWAAIAPGCGVWGGNVLSTQAYIKSVGINVMNSGREWMPTCFPSDYRPNYNSGQVHQFYEAGNTKMYRQAWEDALSAHQHNPSKSRMVSVATWNDYSEHNMIGPSEPGKGIQNLFRDLSAYYAVRYKTGADPVLKRDQLALCHRPERTDTYPQTGSGQPSATKNASSDPPHNNIEALGYLASSGTLEVDRGDGQSASVTGSGLQTVTIPMVTNKTPVARLKRNGATVLSLTSAFPVRAASTSQDLQYKGTTSAATAPGGEIEPPVEPAFEPPPPTPAPVEGGWTPDALGARVLLFGPNAKFSGGAGSALTACPNGGSDKVGASILGPPTQGNPLNGLVTIRADAAAEMLKYNLSGTPAGGMWFFWYGKPLRTDSDQSFIGLNWPAQTAGVAAYLCSTGPAKSVAMGNGYGDQGPRFYTPTNSIVDVSIVDADPHCLFSQLGMSNRQRVDGDEIEITSSIIGDVPAYPASEWTFLHSGASHEVANADTLAVIFGTGTLDDPDIERLEGWAHWMGGSEDMLIEHPYSDAPPMTDEVPPPEPEETVSVDVTGQFEREGTIYEFEGTIEIKPQD